jgi:hypothetical protein
MMTMMTILMLMMMMMIIMATFMFPKNNAGGGGGSTCGIHTPTFSGFARVFQKTRNTAALALAGLRGQPFGIVTPLISRTSVNYNMYIY